MFKEQWVSLIDVSAFTRKYLELKLKSDFKKEAEDIIVQKLYDKLYNDPETIYKVHSPTEDMIFIILPYCTEYVLQLNYKNKIVLEKIIRQVPQCAIHLHLEEDMQHYLMELNHNNFQYLNSPFQSVIDMCFSTNK